MNSKQQYAKIINEAWNNKEPEEQSIIKIPLGAPKRSDAKFTTHKRKILLESLAKEWNITQAAAKIGIARNTVYRIRFTRR